MAKTTWKDYLALGIGAATGIPPGLLDDRWNPVRNRQQQQSGANGSTGDWAGEAGPAQSMPGMNPVPASPNVDLSNLPPSLRPWMQLLGLPNLTVQNASRREDLNASPQKDSTPKINLSGFAGGYDDEENY